MDTDSFDTRMNFMTALALAVYGLSLLLGQIRESAEAHDHKVARCADAAAHKLGVPGNWNDELETCFVRIKLAVGWTAHPEVKEEDVPLDQYPPPTA